MANETTTEAEVERAFQEWCAMMGVSSANTGKPGSFRLVHDEGGKVRIEQVVSEAGEVRAVAPAMTGREFRDAVHLVHESMNIKTVQVARSLSKKRRPRP